MDNLLCKHLTRFSSSGPLSLVCFLNFPFSRGTINFLLANSSSIYYDLIYNLCKMTLVLTFQSIVSSLNCLPHREAKMLFIRRDTKHTVSHWGRNDSLHGLMVRNGHKKLHVIYHSWTVLTSFRKEYKEDTSMRYHIEERSENK